MSILEQHNKFRSMHDRLRDAQAASADMFADIMMTSCHRIFALRHTSQAMVLTKLINAGAWTDAALALIALELSQWQLRRLAYDDGEWHCALSKNREMPDWLDASIETHHADMTLAILDALVEARQPCPTAALQSVSASASRKDDNLYEPMSSDNFA